MKNNKGKNLPNGREQKKKENSNNFPKGLVSSLAEEVAKTLAKMPRFRRLRNKRSNNSKNKIRQLAKENPIFLDTSAIIDGRIFDVVGLGVFTGTFVILESILLELKHIADSQDMVKRVRGRKGLDLLEKLKKGKNKVTVLQDDEDMKDKEVDEKLISSTKSHKGRIITCDYNLEKKAAIGGVLAINVNTLANHLKVTAVPGEALHISILHKGKELGQGVGYLDDGTMLVVENAAEDLGTTIDVVVSRVIQTTAGRILFAKKI